MSRSTGVRRNRLQGASPVHRAIILLLVLSVATAMRWGSVLPAQTARWSVDPTPLLTLGTTGDGSTAEFAFVTGATVLPDNNIMVGDRDRSL